MVPTSRNNKEMPTARWCPLRLALSRGSRLELQAPQSAWGQEPHAQTVACFADVWYKLVVVLGNCSFQNVRICSKHFRAENHCPSFLPWEFYLSSFLLKLSVSWSVLTVGEAFCNTPQYKYVKINEDAIEINEKNTMKKLEASSLVCGICPLSSLLKVYEAFLSSLLKVYEAFFAQSVWALSGSARQVRFSYELTWNDSSVQFSSVQFRSKKFVPCQ